MRFLSWIAGTAVIVALAVGTTSAVAARSYPTHSLNAAQKQVALVVDNGVNAKDPAPQRMIPRPTPDPSPTPPPVAAPAPQPAAPAALVPAAPRPAPPAIVIGSTQQVLINQDRARSGLGPLTWSSCLAGVARSNAARIAAQGSLTHTNGPNLDLNCGLGHQAGENIGYWSAGVNDSQLNTMFMNSAEHRANILGPYHYVASAWVVAANGYGYIAVEFS
ncbi:MAG: CAP domain-containing protein [Candidatus Dormibacteraceae bacterium]